MRRRTIAWLAHGLTIGAVALGLRAVAPSDSARSTLDLTCTPAATARGVAKARAVKGRTDALVAAGHLVREEGGLFLYETPLGQVWMPGDDDLWSLAVVQAEQEHEMYGAPEALGVRRGDVVLDVGAHVGLFAREALAAGASTVVTFEVTPRSNQALRRNLAREIAEGRVIVLEKGAWFEEALLPLVVDAHCSVCNSVAQGGQPIGEPSGTLTTIEVPLTTIDRVVRDLGLHRVDFIKLDIENAEAHALRGATTTLARDHPRLAIALENAKRRLTYGREVLGVVRGAYPGYHFTCGAMTPPRGASPALPEILHAYP